MNIDTRIVLSASYGDCLVELSRFGEYKAFVEFMVGVSLTDDQVGYVGAMYCRPELARQHKALGDWIMFKQRLNLRYTLIRSEYKVHGVIQNRNTAARIQWANDQVTRLGQATYAVAPIGALDRERLIRRVNAAVRNHANDGVEYRNGHRVW